MDPVLPLIPQGSSLQRMDPALPSVLSSIVRQQSAQQNILLQMQHQLSSLGQANPYHGGAINPYQASMLNPPSPALMMLAPLPLEDYQPKPKKPRAVYQFISSPHVYDA
jgi:hypothetical protein